MFEIFMFNIFNCDIKSVILHDSKENSQKFNKKKPTNLMLNINFDLIILYNIWPHDYFTQKMK